MTSSTAVGPGLRDESERDYFAALVVTEAETGMFDFEWLSDAETEFVTGTEFGESYLGVVQVSALTSSMRFEVVDVHESDVNLTVNVAVRDDTPHSDDRVITTLLLRVTRGGERVPMPSPSNWASAVTTRRSPDPVSKVG